MIDGETAMSEAGGEQPTLQVIILVSRLSQPSCLAARALFEDKVHRHFGGSAVLRRMAVWSDMRLEGRLYQASKSLLLIYWLAQPHKRFSRPDHVHIVIHLVKEADQK